MLVKDCMTRHPIMISPKAMATEAQQILAESHIRHLPVVGDGKRLRGLITRRCLTLDPETIGSLNMWEISRYMSGLKVKDLMVPEKKVHTIEAQRSVERAAHIMSEKKIGCLPVVEDKNVIIGIISEIDLLNAFKEMLGLPARGVRLTVRTLNESGQFSRLMSIVSEHNWCVMGIGTYPSPRRAGYYDTVIKISAATAAEIASTIKVIPDLELVDLRETI